MLRYLPNALTISRLVLALPLGLLILRQEFALALGVEQRWAERFVNVLAAIREPNGDGYQPSWYNGTFSTSNLSSATSGLTSGLSSAVTASAMAPGSSSGSGGGGSSGGGGGGGGGGGW